MDPFVDSFEEIDRSFSLRNDLLVHKYLEAKPAKENYNVRVLGLEKVVTTKGYGEKLEQLGAKVLSFSPKEVANVIAESDTSLSMILSEDVSKSFIENFETLLSEKNDGWTPDIIISWGYVPSYFELIYPKSLLLEAEHTAFYRIQRKADVHFTVKNASYLSDFKELVLEQNFLDEEIVALNELKEFLTNVTSERNNFCRETIDPDGKFEKLIFFPGHFECSYYKRFSTYLNDADILKHLLEDLPQDCAVVYSPHPLDKNIYKDKMILEHDQIIDLSALKEADPNISLSILTVVDAVVNSHSKISQLAMLLEKPLFEVDTFYTKFAANGGMKEFKEWCKVSSLAKPFSFEIAKKYLLFLFSSFVTVDFLNTSTNYYSYINRIWTNYTAQLKNIHPITSTCTGALATIETGVYTASIGRPNFLPVICPYEKIRGHILSEQTETIGFDIFDTLVWRPFVKPVDLFDFISGRVARLANREGLDFKATRIDAEWIARKRSSKQGKTDVTIDEIYQAFLEITRLETCVVNKIKQLEIDTEKQFIRPRKSARALFLLAKKLNKKIVLISDMYMTSDILADMLHNCGYCGWDNLFVSSEEGIWKSNGLLFKHVINKLDISTNRFVFIGDNTHSDVLVPQKLGIKSFHYPKATECLEKTRFNGYSIKSLTMHNNMHHIAVLANTIFDNPFTRFNRKTVVNDSPYLLGLMIFGPLMLSYLMWMIDRVDKKTELLLFAARDCRLLEALYSNYRNINSNQELPASKYFYHSRTATLPFYTRRENLVAAVTKYSSNYTVEKFLGKYLNADANVIEQIALKYPEIRTLTALNLEDKIKFQEIILEFSELLASAEEDVTLLKEFFLQEVGDKKCAIVDLGARGTSRDAFSDLTGKKIPAYFFRGYRYKRSELNKIECYHKHSFNYHRQGVPSLLSKFYEPMLSCHLESTCKGYHRVDSKIVPKVEKQPVSSSQCLYGTVQAGIFDFSMKYMEIFKEDTSIINEVSSEAYLTNVEFLCAGFSDRVLLNHFSHSDALISDGTIGNIYFPPLPERNVARPQVKQQEPMGTFRYRLTNAYELRVEEFAKQFKINFPNLSTILSPFWRIMREGYFYTKERYKKKALAD